MFKFASLRLISLPEFDFKRRTIFSNVMFKREGERERERERERVVESERRVAERQKE